ncbi:hypothetical protein Taro_049495 [Colocasia esculenta]|uniref:Pentatricopeptide repeat-containing protein n=1 Tax=Colocasia esculenta TaxID=4460 RepID=A0A843XB42_COLES|nr:hypothetical protein [Colocasia esculenta]
MAPAPLLFLPSRLFATTVTTAKLSSLFSAASSSAGPLSSRKTFSHIFQECASQRDLVAGMAAHARMVTSGFNPTVFVANCLMHMYVRCSLLDLARKVFDHLTPRDTVSWNVMIAGIFARGNTLGVY